MNKALYFSLGAAIGSLVTWFALKKRYEQIAQEEIDSVKEVFKRDAKEEHEEKPEPKLSFREEDYHEYMSMLKNNTYSPAPKEPDNLTKNGIYIIAPDEYGEFSDYNQISLTYYSDDVLTDEEGNVIEDIDGITPEDFLGHFGEYEDDTVYMRSDERCCDYAIFQDLRTYEEVQ